MLTEEGIIKIKEKVTNRPIDKEAVAHLISGYSEFSDKCRELGYPLSEKSAKFMLEVLFLHLQDGRSAITKELLKKFCKLPLPYPWHLWLC